MTWLQRQRVRHYVDNSSWILPLLGIVAALVAVRVLNWVDAVMGWTSVFQPEAARTVLGQLSSATFTLIIFVTTALLIAVQLASAALTPRIIALVFKDPVTKFSLTAFVFSFTFGLAALIRIDDVVHLATWSVAVYGCVASLGVFLYLVDHMGKALRPSGAARAVATLGREVIEGVYPSRLSEATAPAPVAADVPRGAPSCTVPSPVDGVVLAFDVRGLSTLAEKADCVIEMVPQVGDFVAVDDPLFRVFGAGALPPVGALCASVAVGQERTMEQDPAFAFRILVDMASKGLSPAINDPTTAVVALDQIHHLLRIVGTRRLDDGRVRDAAGRLRLVYPTPGWADFVLLAVTEIRHFGGTSIQIARRLRAMLENLIEVLPEERAALLRPELALVHRSVDRFFPEPEDRAQADISDVQGVGGRHVPVRPGPGVNRESPR